MSAPAPPLGVVPPPGPPAVPEGWQAEWSPQHNAWYYMYLATGATQWQPPPMPPTQYGPPPTAIGYPTQPTYAQSQPPSQPFYNPQPYAPAPGQGAFPPPPQHDQAPAQQQSTGVMSKLSNMDPKAQAALAVGGGLLAGAFIEHEVSEHRPDFNLFHHHHSGGQHHHHGGLGTMAGLLGAAGAGALGAKMAGLWGNKPQQQSAPAPPSGGFPPPPQNTGQPPHQQYGPLAGPPPPYPGQGRPPPQGSGGGVGLGKLAAAGGLGAAAGAMASGAGGLFHHHQGGGASPGTMTASNLNVGGAAPGGFAAYSGPPLYIHAAVFGDADVTEHMRRLIAPDQSINLDAEKLKEILGDVWPEKRYMTLSALYQYGDRPMEMMSGFTNSGRLEIKHESLSKARMEYCEAPPSRIVAIVWGFANVKTPQRVTQLDSSGEMDAIDLGDGGWYALGKKVLTVYYRADDGSIQMKSCREGGTVRLPWNPLAKWS